MVRCTRLFLFVSLLVLGSALFSACDNGTAPTPVAEVKQPQCSTGNGGVSVCIDGNGNVVTITLPQPTPTPAPSPAGGACSKAIALYEGNVVQALNGIPAGQSLESTQFALKRSLESVGFKVATGGALSFDEIAVRISDDFSETYDFWKGDPTGPNTGPQVIYGLTCRPAVK